MLIWGRTELSRAKRWLFSRVTPHQASRGGKARRWACSINSTGSLGRRALGSSADTESSGSRPGSRPCSARHPAARLSMQEGLGRGMEAGMGPASLQPPWTGTEWSDSSPFFPVAGLSRFSLKQGDVHALPESQGYPRAPDWPGPGGFILMSSPTHVAPWAPQKLG